MRQHLRVSSEPGIPPSPWYPDPATDRSVLSENNLPADWRELGRRVLSEALRRSVLELERRNGHAGKPAIRRGNPGGFS